MHFVCQSQAPPGSLHVVCSFGNCPLSSAWSLCTYFIQRYLFEMKVCVYLLTLASVWVCCLGASKKQIDEYLNVCLDSKHHKEKPGPESESFADEFHCSPWKKHACCKKNITQKIKDSGTLELYNMHWDQCNRTMSSECRRFFVMDTCFYECSPYTRPWITTDPNSKVTRKERFRDVPLCASDCDEWFEACKMDLTCSDNWGDIKTWNFTAKTCKKECKTFKEYFETPKKFCSKIFNYSFKYQEGKPGEDCMVLWPNATSGNINEKFARKLAEKVLDVSAGSTVVAGILSVHLAVLALSLM